MYRTFKTNNRKLVLFESIFNLTSDAIVVVDLEGKVLEINKKFEELHGWTREEVIGKVLPMTPDHLKKQAYQIHNRILNGEPYTDIEALKLRKDGSTFYADVSISPVKDEEGNIIAFVGAERDITEKKKAEKELLEREEHNRRVLKLSPEPIILHWDGVIQFVNDIGVKLFAGSSMEELIGRSIFDFFCPSYHPVLRERMKQVVQTDDYLEFIELKVKRLDGVLLDVEISSIYIHKNIGQPVIQMVIRDMTERKKTEEMMRRSEKLSVVGQLAAGIAHEIRNPLTSLKGFAQLLKTKNTDYVDVMLEELERIEYIVNEFMTLAKPQMVRHNETRVQSLVNSVVQFMQPQALLFNVQFNLKIDADTHSIFCDANQIKQVVMNILKNAMESMPNGGTVEVAVRNTEEQSVLIQIIDQGTGIPEDKLSKLGEPFFSMKDNGTGLGLMICQGIVEGHNGKMSIQSQINQGTTVNIELPNSSNHYHI